jgi:RimJ/RimL family protein N-acetyltransferase
MKQTPIILRQWRDDDLDPYAGMNADAEVMRFFPKLVTREESKESLARNRAGIEERGWGLWVVEVEGAFAGFTGLAETKFVSHFTPCIEIGWRLRREYWGRGIAYAAALVAQSFAFEKLKLPELVSFTAVINERSRRLMERLEFTRNESDDFLHPSLAEDSPLRPHVLYRKVNAIGSS